MIKTICMCGHEESLRRLRLAFQSLGIELENRDYQLEQDLIDALVADRSIGGILVVEQTTLGLEDGKYGLIERIRAIDQTVRIVFCCNSGKRDSEFENWCYKFAVYDFFYPKKDESYDIGMIAECLRQGRILKDRGAAAEPWRADELPAKAPGFFQKLRQARQQNSPKPTPDSRSRKTKPSKQPRRGKAILEKEARSAEMPSLKPEISRAAAVEPQAAQETQPLQVAQSAPASVIAEQKSPLETEAEKQENMSAPVQPSPVQPSMVAPADKPATPESDGQPWQYPPLTVLAAQEQRQLDQSAAREEAAVQGGKITPFSVLEQKRRQTTKLKQQPVPPKEKPLVREVIKEVVKEVPVEVVREVPIEVVREVEVVKEVVREVPTEREVIRYRDTAGTFSIAVFSLSRGAGATTMAHGLAEALSRADARTALLAVDGKQDLQAAKSRAECYVATGYDDALASLQRLSAGYHDFMVADFGTLFDIAANGAAADDYLAEKSALIQEFFRCNLHIGMAFGGPWHGNKLRYFTENEAMAQRLEYGSYTFVLDGDIRPYRKYGLELLERSAARPEMLAERLWAKEKPRKRGFFLF